MVTTGKVREKRMIRYHGLIILTYVFPFVVEHLLVTNHPITIDEHEEPHYIEFSTVLVILFFIIGGLETTHDSFILSNAHYIIRANAATGNSMGIPIPKAMVRKYVLSILLYFE